MKGNNFKFLELSKTSKLVYSKPYRELEYKKGHAECKICFTYGTQISLSVSKIFCWCISASKAVVKNEINKNNSRKRRNNWLNKKHIKRTVTQQFSKRYHTY